MRVVFLLATILAFVSASDVLVLDPSNFDQHVGGDKPVFVEFFAPWCGHCKSLAPEYELTATAFKGKPVHIASVDADAHRDLGSRFDVKGFPTLKFFPAGSTEPEAYSGGRTAADITDFINKKTGVGGKIKTAASDVVVLTPDNFDSVVLDSTKDVLVEFYAPWCGHCKSLAPEYEKVGSAFKNDANVIVAKLDADAHRDLGTKYGVTGFPTIKFFPKSNKEGVEYSSGRDVSSFITYLNEQSGSERVLGGGYSSTAGRISSLDSLASKLKSASDASERASIAKEIEAAITSSEVTEDKNAKYAKFYSLTASKVASNPEWAANEATRLTRMIEKGGVNAKQLESFYIRINIANAF